MAHLELFRRAANSVSKLVATTALTMTVAPMLLAQTNAMQHGNNSALAVTNLMGGGAAAAYSKVGLPAEAIATVNKTLTAMAEIEDRAATLKKSLPIKNGTVDEVDYDKIQQSFHSTYLDLYKRGNEEWGTKPVSVSEYALMLATLERLSQNTFKDAMNAASKGLEEPGYSKANSDLMLGAVVFIRSQALQDSAQVGNDDQAKKVMKFMFIVREFGLVDSKMVSESYKFQQNNRQLDPHENFFGAPGSAEWINDCSFLMAESMPLARYDRYVKMQKDFFMKTKPSEWVKGIGLTTVAELDRQKILSAWFSPLIDKVTMSLKGNSKPTLGG